MRLFGKRAADEEDISFTVAAEPPWPGAWFAVVLGLFAALALAGVDLPPDRFPLLIPMVTALAVMWVVGKLRQERSITLVERGGRKLLVYWSRGGIAEVVLDELASASREHEGASPALTLADLRGATVTIPLGTWTNEARLLEKIEAAVKESGADGRAGSPVHVHKPRWIAPARVILFVAALAPIVVLVNQVPARSEPIEPVTRERIENTLGRTTSPFAGSRGCDVYVVPLDRASEDRVSDLARALAQRAAVSSCVTPSLAIDVSALDAGRRQLDASILLSVLTDRFRVVWGDRTSTIVGITELDLFTTGNPALRFTFGSSYRRTTPPQGYAALSTARMGSGDDRIRRLETMAMRSLGFQHFGLTESQDPSSALYHTIRSRSDLDRMRPQFGDPPPSEADLRRARARFLAGG